MSIIYDALKKVEETYNKNLLPETDKKHKPKRKTYLSYGLVLCAGLIIAGLSFNFFTFFYSNLSKSESDTVYSKKSQSPKAGQNAAMPPETSSPNELPIVSLPERKKQLESSLVLNGVFFSENEGGYALINNQIVKEGDVINGATIKKIGLDEVKVELQDSVFILSDRR